MLHIIIAHIRIFYYINCDRGANMTLKDTRKKCNLTQKEAAEIIGIALRTYIAYEADEKKADKLKLERMVEKLNEHAENDTSILKDKVLLILVEQDRLATQSLIDS